MTTIGARPSARKATCERAGVKLSWSLAPASAKRLLSSDATPREAILTLDIDRDSGAVLALDTPSGSRELRREPIDQGEVSIVTDDTLGMRHVTIEHVATWTEDVQTGRVRYARSPWVDALLPRGGVARPAWTRD